ncbi:MAG TPA: hypothetical protein PLI17_17015, partial [Denitromonas sp.]|nr:hypothetical protein [Denitromonas sp.]
DFDVRVQEDGAVEVFSRETREETWGRTTQCLMVFVAIDDAGKPSPVPSFQPENEQEKRLADYAGRMKELSLALEEERNRWLKGEIPAS